MPKAKKKFIDRKNAVTFHLVHRSQQDPLIADETAPQHVLLEAPDSRPKGDDKKRKEEQKKFGIFFDDDYNYLQHLRDVEKVDVDWEPTDISQQKKRTSEKTKLMLPSSVFGSQVEEDTGLLNRAAPESGLRLDLDPDIVAAMDEDFDFEDPENQLEDNFMEMATGEGDSDVEADDEQSYETCSNASSGVDSLGEDRDDVASLTGPQFTFAQEETKSRFTNYSMSSSMIRRNEHLSLLDSRFEQMYAGYDDTEIGALDCEEIEGYVAPNSEMVMQCAEEFARERAALKHETEKTLLLQQDGSDSDSRDELVEFEVKDNKDKWDCESILSTYSNLYNHPRIIEEPSKPHPIRVSGRTGIPLGILDGDSNKLTTRTLARHNADIKVAGDHDGAESVISALSTLSVRPKDETAQQRRDRKKALREYRKERRTEKKANTLAFKEEKKRQEKVILNNKTNIHGVRIL